MKKQIDPRLILLFLFDTLLKKNLACSLSNMDGLEYFFHIGRLGLFSWANCLPSGRVENHKSWVVLGGFSGHFWVAFWGFGGFVGL